MIPLVTLYRSSRLKIDTDSQAPHYPGLTTVDELFDASPVVDEVCALLDRVPGRALRVQGSFLQGPGVAHAAPAGGPAVAPAHVAPEGGGGPQHHQRHTPAQNDAGHPGI